MNNENDPIDTPSTDTTVTDEHAADKESSDNLDAAALVAQNEKLQKDYLYLRADFDNYRKSVIKDRADLMKYGSERVFTELLDVLDNFERALETKLTADTLENYKAGIALTASELRKVLQKFGVQEIECDGAPFDPNIHEALSSEETAERPAGHITRVFKKAYKLHDRVIRPAQVVVAKEVSKQQ